MVGIPPPPAPDSNDAESKDVSPMTLQAKLAVMALFIMGFLDTLGYMALMPTLIFYVRAVGGDEGQYGSIMAANNFSAFLMMPIYASYVDATGKFRKVFFLGTFLCILGQVFYTFAIVFGETGLAVHVLLASRTIYGIGAAAFGAVGFTYIALMVEPEQLTLVTTILTFGSGQGLVFGPFINQFLEGINTSINVFGLTVPILEINAVGIFIACTQLISVILTYFFLPEVSTKKKDEDAALIEKAKSLPDDEQQSKREDTGWASIFREFATDIKLLLPVFAVFVASSNFQLIENAFPPATAHALGWGPAETAEIFSYNTIVMMISMFSAMGLSQKYNLNDTSLIIGGNITWAISGILMYLFWTYPAEPWQLVTPFTVAMIGMPIIGPALQSMFTKAILSRPELEPIQTRLQSVLSMTGEVANFLTPLFVGNFVLRSPETIENGINKHEITAYSLYVPILSTLCILGFLYERNVLHADDDVDDGLQEEESTSITETTMLLKEKTKFKKSRRSSLLSIQSSLSADNEAKKHRASAIMGSNHAFPVYVPFDTPSEKKRREKSIRLRKQWVDLVATIEKSSGSKKMIVLITSYSANRQQKSHQDRALTILKGLKIGEDQLETIDGAKPENKEKRNELFGLSGIRAKYPQFFLVDGSDTTSFLADFDGFEAMHEMGTLLETMKLDDAVV